MGWPYDNPDREMLLRVNYLDREMLLRVNYLEREMMHRVRQVQKLTSSDRIFLLVRLFLKDKSKS